MRQHCNAGWPTWLTGTTCHEVCDNGSGIAMAMPGVDAAADLVQQLVNNAAMYALKACLLRI